MTYEIKEIIMSAGITRIHGTAQAQTLHGGYQLRWFEFAGDASNVAVDGVFETAVRKIETIATVVVLGIPTAAGFMVGLDGGSVAGRGDNTGYAADSTALDLSALTGFTVTEKKISAKAFAAI
ncbi:MAG: hypothetical protein WCP55_00335 [Lentisphaerota bacterium]